MHVHACTYTCACTHIARSRVCVHMCMFTCACSCVRVHMCIFTCACFCVRIHMCPITCACGYNVPRGDQRTALVSLGATFHSVEFKPPCYLLLCFVHQTSWPTSLQEFSCLCLPSRRRRARLYRFWACKQRSLCLRLPDKGLLSLPPLPGNTWKHPLINILTEPFREVLLLLPLHRRGNCGPGGQRLFVQGYSFHQVV